MTPSDYNDFYYVCLKLPEEEFDRCFVEAILEKDPTEDLQILRAEVHEGVVQEGDQQNLVHE